jgi:hypothetical protein
VVWCGVVWCGVVWCGVVWCGVVWCAWQGSLVPALADKIRPVRNHVLVTAPTAPLLRDGSRCGMSHNDDFTCAGPITCCCHHCHHCPPPPPPPPLWACV